MAAPAGRFWETVLYVSLLGDRNITWISNRGYHVCAYVLFHQIKNPVFIAGFYTAKHLFGLYRNVTDVKKISVTGQLKE